LAADGVNPGLPDGVPLYPGGALTDYYGRAIADLSVQLAPHGYSVLPHGYDWRVSSQRSGPALAARIRQEVTSADPCSIVAHSFGGLVARLAWADLVRTGETALVRRIVTLGTPHWGSYGAVRLWSLDHELISQLAYLSYVAVPFYGPAVATATGKVWYPARLAALSATWPALYETLPSLLAPDAARDPHRAALYGNTWPADRGISPAWLAYARDTFQPLLASAATNPPTWVLTTVGGEGYPTVDALEWPQWLGSPLAYETAGDGDGTVPISSALLPNSAQITIVGAHGDLPLISAGFQGAAAVILENRAPPDPPPPVQAVPGVFLQSLHGPPAPGLLVPWGDC
jgi:hypothetical protein